MKTLLVHNEYGIYSGEERAVDMMAVMLKSIGIHTVQLRTSTCKSQDSLISKINVSLNSIYSCSGIHLMRKSLKENKPDIVIINNLYPFISPWALLECKKAKVPVVMRVHNYRLLCPNGLFYNTAVCELCLKHGNELSCIFHNCTGKILKSIIYALRNAIARYYRLYINNVDRYICLTNFQKYKLIESGVPERKIDVIVNHVVDLPKRDIVIGNYVGFCGRLSSEKGIDMILKAAELCPDIPFKLAGKVHDFCFSNLPANVELCGFLEKDKLERFYLEARFMIIGSKCYEGQPMAVIEAALYSKVSIIPLHGGFLEILSSSGIQEFAGYKVGDLTTMIDKIKYLWNKPLDCIKLGKLLRSVIEKEYSLNAVSDKWKRVLENVITLKI